MPWDELFITFRKLPPEFWISIPVFYGLTRKAIKRQLTDSEHRGRKMDRHPDMSPQRKFNDDL